MAVDPQKTASMVPIKIDSNNAFVVSNSDLLKKFCAKPGSNTIIIASISRLSDLFFEMKALFEWLNASFGLIGMVI